MIVLLTAGVLSRFLLGSTLKELPQQVWAISPIATIVFSCFFSIVILVVIKDAFWKTSYFALWDDRIILKTRLDRLFRRKGQIYHHAGIKSAEWVFISKEYHFEQPINGSWVARKLRVQLVDSSGHVLTYELPMRDFGMIRLSGLKEKIDKLFLEK